MRSVRPGRGASAAARSRRAPEQTPLARAKALALRYLASRPRTEAQVRARLARAELAAEADAVVAWLLALGYLDDAAYARARALVASGAGPRLAERRLAAAGVEQGRAKAAVAAAVEEVAEQPAGQGEVTLCRALAERRARTRDLAALDPRARSRLVRFLLGRGFSGAVVAGVLGVYEDGT